MKIIKPIFILLALSLLNLQCGNKNSDLKDFKKTSSPAISSQQVNLLQETQEISCNNNSYNVSIEKKDKFFIANNKTYTSLEFLDQGILGQSSSSHALLQVTPKNTALLIEGPLIDFREGHCRQVKDSKVCTKGSTTIKWSPTTLEFNGVPMNVRHYGVYPNDGTFFIAYDSGAKAMAIIDYGSKFQVLFGNKQALTCFYN